MKQLKRQKILLLSGALGDGHKQAARAILEASKLYRPEVEVEEIDFMEWTHPHLHSVGKYCYTQWMKKFPSVYGYLFQKTRDDNSLSNLFKKMKSFSLSRMLKLLQEVQPTVVVSTFPSAAAAMSILKAHGLTEVPTVTVITDHTDHSYWIHPYTDQYIVGSEPVRQALLRRSITDAQISVTGIPIRLSYNQSFDCNRLRDRYSLDRSLPTVLVMGGGLGMIDKEFIALLKSEELPASVQFIIVCGRNLKLQQQLAEELRYVRHHILITGFVDHVHEFMALSDLIITKPGGLTTSEALALELPMLLFKPLPGQEKDNAAYLVKIGAALEAASVGELKDMLTAVLADSNLLRAMKQKASKFTLKSSSLSALHTILEAKYQSVPVWEDSLQTVYAEA
ncbi:MGDG synthase family glycosyltransferase [Paenibacillus eucommiae]|uniref:Processive 1,2-diacylglycerol beta-glucosyltransferase n=1 Tax=Paenibacillus eucommiae TaxID=1355755 RepID=A0ABS4J7R0_9BACL|nr:glycosyltransferase [Paenibacillus eucommiae]MBP1995868.1 processive 1,2-diacylglycerol beta-glucosyltransferase [Paenibacillus eucommiae]